MRWLLLLVAVLGVTYANKGRMLNMYASDPNLRTQQVPNQFEDIRQVPREFSRQWMVDKPSHLTPDRTHGGIGP